MSVQRTSNSDAIRKRLRDLQRKHVEVGFFETAHYPDGTPVAYVAAIQEFGSGAIPARPFFRPTVSSQQAGWSDNMRQAVAAIARGDAEVIPALTQVGMAAAGDVSVTITKVTAPPLSLTTLILRAQKKKEGFQAGGKAVGAAHREANFTGPRQDKGTDISGVSTKPLIDTGLMLQSVTAQVTDK